MHFFVSAGILSAKGTRVSVTRHPAVVAVCPDQGNRPKRRTLKWGDKRGQAGVYSLGEPRITPGTCE